MEILAGLQSMTLGLKSLKAIKDLSDSNEFQLKMSEILDSVVTTQTGALELVEKINNLQDELRNATIELSLLKGKNEERKCFSIVNFEATEGKALKHKNEERYACLTCWESDRRIITLQKSSYSYVCPKCKSNAFFRRVPGMRVINPGIQP